MGELIRAAAVDLDRISDASVARIKRAGFDAIDLSVSAEAFLTAGTAAAQARRAGALVKQGGVKVVSVTFALPAAPGIDTGPGPHPWPVDRAGELIRAVSICSEPVCVIAPPPVIPPQDGERVYGYQDAINLTHRALTELCVQAECSGVTLAVRAPSEGCLLSPVELRELIDAVSSPSVSACIDVQALEPIGRLDDWLRTLRCRIAALRMTLATFEACRDTLARAATNTWIVVIQ